MSIETHPGAKPLLPAPPPNWGEFTPEGEVAVAVRFLLEQSVVTIPAMLFRRWEHTHGTPETLVIGTGSERIVIEGRNLGEVRAALDLGRLCELRVNYTTKAGARPGPHIRRITIEPA